MNQPNFTVTLQEKRLLTPDILELKFTKPEDFIFFAGQFVQFEIPDGENMVLRSYSISSTPAEDYLEFCVKILPDGKASQYFNQMRIGESIAIRGPRGIFYVKEKGNIHCIATGAGIAPIMGILQDELKNKKTDKNIHLLFGVRSQEDVFWKERFELFAQEYPQFSYFLTLSQPRENLPWGGLTGRVTAHLPKEVKESQFFLCGSPDMVKETRAYLVENGVEGKNIRFEIF